MPSFLRSALPAILLLLLAAPDAVPADGVRDPGIRTASVIVTIPPKKWKATRLLNLPKNAFVEVSVKGNAPLTVLLLGEESYRNLPSVKRPLFRGEAMNNLAFSLSVPATGHYYVVLFNRSGARAVSAELIIRAARGDGAHI